MQATNKRFAFSGFTLKGWQLSCLYKAAVLPVWYHATGEHLCCYAIVFETCSYHAAQIHAPASVPAQSQLLWLGMPGQASKTCA